MAAILRTKKVRWNVFEGQESDFTVVMHLSIVCPRMGGGGGTGNPREV